MDNRIYVNNTIAVGIATITRKQQQSRALEMRYFKIFNGEAQKLFKISQHPGAENLGDYPSKAHVGHIHQHVRPYYIWQHNLPTVLSRALQPSARQGCAEILDDRYLKKVPLPRIPTFRTYGSIARPYAGQYRTSVRPVPAAE